MEMIPGPVVLLRAASSVVISRRRGFTLLGRRRDCTYRALFRHIG